MDTRLELDRLVEEVRRQRDELRVKIHLAKADARDEWQELEKKWEQFSARAGAVGGEAEEAAKDVLSAAKGVVEEIKRGYERIRGAM